MILNEIHSVAQFMHLFIVELSSNGIVPARKIPQDFQADCQNKKKTLLRNNNIGVTET
jgi:hypothetical protein